MKGVAALLYDGRSSAATHVTLELRPVAGELHLSILQGELQTEVPFAACTCDAGAGDTHQRIELPSGESIEITDSAAWNALLQQYRLQRSSRALGRLERRWVAVAAAVAVAVLCAWAGFRFGVPALVERALVLTPPALDQRIGAGGLALLDQRYFAPTRLPAQRIEQLREAFSTVARDTGMSGRVRIVFREGKELGPNAFALPDGLVVLTDELVMLARHDDELRAVFAHEIGHVQHRHAMRALLSSSMNGLLAVVILGDVSSATALIAGVPVTLAHAANSRDFEREADEVARKWLRQAGISPSRLSDLLQRLERETDVGDWGYLSSHPPLAERVQATTR